LKNTGISTEAPRKSAVQPLPQVHPRLKQPLKSRFGEISQGNCFNHMEIENKNRLQNLLFFIFSFSSFAIIIWSAKGDLWIDEVWSVLFAENAKTIFDVFNITHDNNHVLNTLFLHNIGPQENVFAYRALSVIAGIGSLILALKITRSWTDEADLITIAYIGFSYPLIVFFSEARGYALAIFFSLLAFHLVSKNFYKFKLPELLLLWTTLILGFLSHATFVIFLIALIFYVCIELLLTNKKSFTALSKMFVYFGLPVLFVVLFYLYFYFDIIIGKGTVISYQETLATTLSLLFGLPGDVLSYNFLASAYVLIVLASIIFLIKMKDRTWLFYLATLTFVPFFILVLTNYQYLQPRYFIVCFPFFYLMVINVFSHLFKISKHKYQYPALVLSFIFVFGQIGNISHLIHDGRGSFSSIMEHIVSNSENDEITISGDHDLRVGQMVMFYSRFIPEAFKIEYIKYDERSGKQADWLILHAVKDKPEYKQKLDILELGEYMFVSDYPTHSLSGLYYYLYYKAPQ
jgi:hypothetical protein